MECLNCKKTLNAVPRLYAGAIKFGTSTLMNRAYIMKYTHPNGWMVSMAGGTTDASGVLQMTLPASIQSALEFSDYHDGHHTFKFYDATTNKALALKDDQGQEASCILLTVEECTNTTNPITLRYLNETVCDCSPNCQCLSCQSN